jgi:protein O-GlcNAc transferase
LNQIEDSIVAYEMAIRLNPDFAEAYNNLGVIAKETGNYERSIQLYEAALRINPHFSQTLNNLGVIYTMIGRMTEGFHYCSLAVKVNPDYSEAYNNLGVLFRDEGRIEEAVEMYQKCLALNGSSRNAGQNRLLALNYSPKYSLSFVSEQHRNWGISFSKLYDHLSFLPSRKESSSSCKLRIGFVSPDICTHSVSYFIEAPLRMLNRSKFEIYIYSNVSRMDSRTEMFMRMNHHWRNVFNVTTDAACQMIVQDGIDILVDLTGHTAGNRLDIFAVKPAPIQVTWIGYPNSTGLQSMDYRITDDVADPEDSRQEFTEKLIRLPGAFLCYTPPDLLPAVSPPPFLKHGFITFGSFNNLAKITPEVVSLWSEVLNAVPNSRMLMKCKPFATKEVQERVLQTFESFGVDPIRIDLLPLASKTEDHLSMYSLVDIALDSFPYAGTTTTCESLVMGVPVITLSGSCHAQNVGKSLISRIDLLRFCIASSAKEYVSIAVELCKNRRLLERLRLKTRSEFMRSSLCDGEGFSKILEECFLSLSKEIH